MGFRPLIYLLLYFSFLIVNPVRAEDFPACECPKVACGSCYEETAIKFYSEKCGPGGTRVRSCAKPTCALMNPLPSTCEQAKVEKPESSRAPAMASALPSTSTAAVKIPAVERTDIRGPIVAEVKELSGKAWVKPIDGKKEALNRGAKVHERDMLFTDDKSFMRLQFFDGNEVSLTENSEVSLDRYENNMSDKKRAVLKLLKGRVRNQVKQKYDGPASSYQVRTPTAVAGVRGTDFVVSHSVGEKIISEVSTFEGEVRFEGDHPGIDDAISVNAGEQVRFVVAANSSDVFSEDEMQSFIAKGYMTPVYKMSAADISKIDTETSGKKRSTASEEDDEPTCKAPTAKFNQCRWKCENNPKGSDRCRTEMPQVHCVRKRCDANGNWSDESRLPASFHEACEAFEVRVGACDY